MNAIVEDVDAILAQLKTETGTVEELTKRENAAIAKQHNEKREREKDHPVRVYHAVAKGYYTGKEEEVTFACHRALYEAAQNLDDPPQEVLSDFDGKHEHVYIDLYEFDDIGADKCYDGTDITQGFGDLYDVMMENIDEDFLKQVQRDYDGNNRRKRRKISTSQSNNHVGNEVSDGRSNDNGEHSTD